MDNVKNDLYYVHKIQEDLAFIMRYMKDVNSEELARNELLQDSMMFRLIQIVASLKLPKVKASGVFYCYL